MSETNAEPTNKKKGLGRGLGSLLGGSNSSEGMASKTVAHDVDSHLNIQAKHNNNNFAGASVAPKAQNPAAAPAPVNTEGKVWQVAIDKLSSGEFQPRRHFEKTSLQELSQSIKENGILQPIIARKIAGGRLEIVAGERRWRAAQAAGLHEVPVLIK
ncbi:MAG: ParB/RepB/Spo0J family partition protein, partial [Bdellovibrionaceae bacterium]|nr:ParB/RepB/Spo0J family partition protein [Pseudobdellovibrionaceae bacterium]